MRENYLLLWLLILVVLITGLFFPFLQGSDATEYASIATQMFYRNDWVNIVNHDPVTGGIYDYLDKPHLLFWSAMIGYKIFGVSAVGYRFVSVLMSLAGAYATYRLGRLLYNINTGKIAAVFFITAQAIILANHDVKTDTLLTAFVALSLWQFAEFTENGKLLNMVLGAAFLAGGVGTKGLIAVLVTGSGILFYLIGKRNWKSLFNWKWLIGLVVFFLVLSPVLYDYYLQFDLHPEKLVNGRHGQSGVKFLLWSQSFERFAGGRSLSPEFSFFFHTLLWAFLPWSVLAYYGSFYRLRELVKTKGGSFFSREQLTFTGLWVMFVIMSLSKFKLPHYLNVLLPMFAVFTAGFINQLWQERKVKILQVLTKVQWGIVFLALLVMVIINGWCFPTEKWWIVVIAAIGVIYIFSLLRKKEKTLANVWCPSAMAIIVLNFVLNTNFYPQIDRYQAGSAMALEIKNKNIDPAKVYNYGNISHPFDFYTQHWTPVLTDEQIRQKIQQKEDVLVFVDDKSKKQLDQKFLTEVVLSTPDFGIAGVTGPFLNPNKRKNSYQDAYLLRIR